MHRPHNACPKFNIWNQHRSSGPRPWVERGPNSNRFWNGSKFCATRCDRKMIDRARVPGVCFSISFADCCERGECLGVVWPRIAPVREELLPASNDSPFGKRPLAGAWAVSRPRPVVWLIENADIDACVRRAKNLNMTIAFTGVRGVATGADAPTREIGGDWSESHLGTSKNKPYSSNTTKLPANDSASFPFQFINVHSEAVSDRQRDQFFEVPISFNQ